MILVIYADGDGDAYVRYLTTAGFSAVAVSTNAAVDIVDRTLATRPDMIVLDYDCDGDTVDQLKSDKRTAPIPIIVLAEFPGLQAGAASRLVREWARMDPRRCHSESSSWPQTRQCRHVC